MDITKEQIIAKGRGIADAISTMTAKEREHLPLVDFANDYNNLRKLALEIMPDLERVFPPEARIDKAMGMTRVLTRYTEILSFVNQIIGLIGKP